MSAPKKYLKRMSVLGLRMGWVLFFLFLLPSVEAQEKNKLTEMHLEKYQSDLEKYDKQKQPGSRYLALRLYENMEKNYDFEDSKTVDIRDEMWRAYLKFAAECFSLEYEQRQAQRDKDRLTTPVLTKRLNPLDLFFCTHTSVSLSTQTQRSASLPATRPTLQSLLQEARDGLLAPPSPDWTYQVFCFDDDTSRALAALKRDVYSLRSFLQGTEKSPAFLNGQLQSASKGRFEEVFEKYEPWWDYTFDAIVRLYYKELEKNQFRLLPETDAMCDQLLEYGFYLAGLNPDDFDSLFQGAEYFKKNISQRSEFLRVVGYLQYRAFCEYLVSRAGRIMESRWRMEEEWRKSPHPTERKENIYSPTQDEELLLHRDVDAFKKNGIAVRQPGEEEGWEAHFRPDFISEHIGQFLPEYIRQYLILDNRGTMRFPFVDAALCMPFEECGERARGWEIYAEKHPDSFYAVKAEQRFSILFGVFRHGVDNTPITDFERKKLIPEVKTAWANYIKKHAGSKSAERLKTRYEFFAQHNFKWSKELEDELANSNQQKSTQP